MSYRGNDARRIVALQISNLLPFRQLLDFPFGARCGSPVFVEPGADQSSWRMRACVACAASFGMRLITGFQMIGDACIERTVAAFDQVQIPRAIDGNDVCHGRKSALDAPG